VDLLREADSNPWGCFQCSISAAWGRSARASFLAWGGAKGDKQGPQAAEMRSFGLRSPGRDVGESRRSMTGETPQGVEVRRRSRATDGEAAAAAAGMDARAVAKPPRTRASLDGESNRRMRRRGRMPQRSF